MTISVTPNSSATPPSCTVDLDVTPGSVMTEVSVWRNSSSGPVLLRAQPSAGFDSRSVVDFECPYEVATTYGWSASYVDAGADLFDETWASLAAWTTSGASWSVSSGSVVWGASDSLTASVERVVAEGVYRITIDGVPTGLSRIDFGGFYIDVNNSRLYIGASSVLFSPGSTTWLVEVTESAVTITTSVGAYSLAGSATVSGVEFLGAVRGSAFSLASGSTGTGDGQFYVPAGVAVDSSGNIYVVDHSNQRIQKFNSSGVFQSKFGSSGTGDGQFTNPQDVAVDSSGNIYVVEYTGNRIQKFDSSGTFVWKTGTAGSGDGEFNLPRGIAVDSSGNVFVVDAGNSRVQKFNSSGVFQSKFGTLGTGDGQFSTKPNGIWIDSSNNIFVADIDRNRITKFNSAGTFVLKFGTSGTADGQLTWPYGVATDAAGNIYVSDGTSPRIQKFNSTGTYIARIASTGSSNGQITGFAHLAVDSTDRLIVSDSGNNRFQVFTTTPTSIPPIKVTEYGGPATIAETSAPISLTPGNAWVIHPGTAGLSVPLSETDAGAAGIVDISPVENASNATVHQILGAATPIPTTTGPRNDDRTVMTIVTVTSAESTSVRALLAPDVPLLVQIPPSWDLDFNSGFYQVGDTATARTGEPRSPRRVWTLPLQKVQSPVVDIENSGWSYAATAAEFPTYSSLLTSFATYADLASNTRA